MKTFQIRVMAGERAGRVYYCQDAEALARALGRVEAAVVRVLDMDEESYHALGTNQDAADLFADSEDS